MRSVIGPANHFWPCTVMSSRYGGAYEGAAWVAFADEPWSVPAAAAGSDLPCRAFYEDNKELVGLGDTPDAAVENLRRKIVRWGTRRPDTDLIMLPNYTEVPV